MLSVQTDLFLPISLCKVKRFIRVFPCFALTVANYPILASSASLPVLHPSIFFGVFKPILFQLAPYSLIFFFVVTSHSDCHFTTPTMLGSFYNCSKALLCRLLHYGLRGSTDFLKNVSFKYCYFLLKCFIFTVIKIFCFHLFYDVALKLYILTLCWKTDNNEQR